MRTIPDPVNGAKVYGPAEIAMVHTQREQSDFLGKTRAFVSTPTERWAKDHLVSFAASLEVFPAGNHMNCPG